MLSKINFNKNLSDIDICFYSSSGKNKFNVELSVLLEIAKKEKWIHKLDEYVPLNEKDEPKVNSSFESDIITKQNKEIEELKKQLEIFKNELLKKDVEIKKLNEFQPDDYNEIEVEIEDNLRDLLIAFEENAIPKNQPLDMIRDYDENELDSFLSNY